MRILALMALAALLGGCTNAALSAGRKELAAGQYEQAHADLTSALNAKLSAGERREALDALCVAEFNIGPPRYSLLAQHRTCTRAGGAAGSQSAEILARIDTIMRAQTAAEIQTAVARQDLSGAISAALRYQQIEPPGTPLPTAWRTQIWALVAKEERSEVRARGRRMGRIVAGLGAEYPRERKMSRADFERWLAHAAWKPEASAIVSIALKKHRLDLIVQDDQLGGESLDARRFGEINDAFSAWCRCDAVTHAIGEQSGLPVYLAHINPLVGHSEVFVLPHSAPGA